MCPASAKAGHVTGSYESVQRLFKSADSTGCMTFHENLLSMKLEAVNRRRSGAIRSFFVLQLPTSNSNDQVKTQMTQLNLKFREKISKYAIKMSNTSILFFTFTFLVFHRMTALNIPTPSVLFSSREQHK